MTERKDGEIEYYSALDGIELTIIQVKGKSEDCYIRPFGKKDWIRYRDDNHDIMIMTKTELPKHPMDYETPGSVRPFFCFKCGKDKDIESDCEHEGENLKCSKCDSTNIESHNELMEYGNTEVIYCKDCNNSHRYSL